MAQDQHSTTSDTQEQKHSVNIVRDRTTAGCLTEGWRLLADNIWSLLRLSWPLLAAYALWGICFGLNQLPAFSSTALGLTLTIAGIILDLIFIWHTALLIRRYNQLGYFPATTMLQLWRTDGTASLRALLRQLRLLITSPRQWLSFLVIIIVAGLVFTLVAMLFAMPYVLINIINLQTTYALSIGDAVELPAYLNWLFPTVMAAASTFLTIASWSLLMPLAFHAGKLLHLHLESKKQPLEEKN